MKKLFQKLLGKLIKKAVNKAVSNTNEVSVPEVNPIPPVTDPDIDPNASQDSAVKTKVPWWVIVLKVIAYIIGLILGGVVTTSCAGHIL